MSTATILCYKTRAEVNGAMVPMRTSVKLFKLLTIIFLLSVQIMGCGNAADSSPTPSTVSSQPQGPESDIRAAIQEHLTHDRTLNLQAFDTKIGEVSIQGDKAQAKVSFQIKNSPGAMEMTYQLERRDGAWAVVNSSPTAGDSSHPPLDQAQNPANGAPPGANHSLADTLRSFRDDANGVQPNLPPGHPPTNASGNAAPR
jgi:hypothetical protein